MVTAMRGRPRSKSSREAILASAFELLAARGYDATSIEAVAAAAGVAKTTVYRWWSRKADLAIEAFFEATKAELVIPDTGSSREDFRAQIVALAALLNGDRGKVLAAMLGGARTDPALAAALGERWLRPRRQWGFARMIRAIENRETRPGIDPGAALGILYGPLYAPLLFGQDVPTAAMVEAHLAIALDAIFLPASAAPAAH